MTDKKYSMKIYWSDDEEYYIVECPEFGILADGESRESGILNMGMLIGDWIQIEKEDKGTIPEPIIWERRNV